MSIKVNGGLISRAMTTKLTFSGAMVPNFLIPCNGDFFRIAVPYRRPKRYGSTDLFIWSRGSGIRIRNGNGKETVPANRVKNSRLLAAEARYPYHAVSFVVRGTAARSRKPMRYGRRGSLSKATRRSANVANSI